MPKPKSLLSTMSESIRLQFRFAITSSVATAIDYGLYLLLVYTIFTPVASNILSYSIAVLVNYFLQKRFIFELRRQARQAFILSICISVGGLALSTLLIYHLSAIPFFSQHQYITKILATGIMFFYNFFLKRFAFERRFV